MTELPESVLTCLNTRLESWEMRKIFAGVLPKVRCVVEVELSAIDVEIPVSVSNWVSLKYSSI